MKIFDMRKLSLIISIFFFNITFSQRRLYDPTIVAQEKRQVFESWGDWRPYGKYFLGVQTNLNYATVWGWLAPARNRRYKKGKDIRPLKPGGIENQRLAEVKLQEEETKRIKVEIDSIHKRNIQDFAHWTPLTVDADPLWLLYYKRMLKPLNDFNMKPSNYQEWGFKNQESYEFMKSMGLLENLQRKLDLLKANYTIARTFPMPRGKRFLKYHKCLIGWRELQTMIKESGEESNLLAKWNKMISKKKKIQYTPKTDTEIVSSVINDYNKNKEK